MPRSRVQLVHVPIVLERAQGSIVKPIAQQLRHMLCAVGQLI